MGGVSLQHGVSVLSTGHPFEKINQEVFASIFLPVSLKPALGGITQ
jgi:hypothetical protein